MSTTQFQPRYHWKRRTTQLCIFLLIILIPTFGLFRIDLATASFYFRDIQLKWTNDTFLLGFVIVIITAPFLTYKALGSSFCGWACPQNLFSEFADGLTHKLLGKRADVRLKGPGMIVAASKNKAINWLILGLSFLAASAVLAFFFLMYFYKNSDMWAFVTGESIRQPSMIVMYWMTTFFIFIDIATVRYLYCDYPCPYRVWLRLFRNRNALHVSYDASRSSTCEKCNYCATSCITDIQPTKIEITDTCVDCGECIDACDKLQAKTGATGLLSFKFSESRISDSGKGMTWQKMLGKSTSVSKFLLVAMLLLGCTLMVWQVEIASQKSVDKAALLLENQKILKIDGICYKQCANVQATCNGKNMAGCFRASACRCACKLKQEPTSRSADSLRQCVRYGTAHAHALNLRLLKK